MFYENTKKLNPEIQNDNDIVILEYCKKEDVHIGQNEEICNKSQFLSKISNLKN